MKQCKICNSYFDDPGVICLICKLFWEKEKSIKKSGKESTAYLNMMKGKLVHPCPNCKRLTPDSEGSICKICKKPEIKKSTIKGDKVVKPRNINWERLAGYTMITTVLTVLGSIVASEVPVIFQTLLYVLLSRDILSYHYRIPLSVPFIFISYGLFWEIYKRLYYNPPFPRIIRFIRNTKSTLKIYKDNLVLSFKIWYNARQARKRNIQAYRKQQQYDLDLLKSTVKLSEEGEGYESTKNFVRTYQENSNLEQYES